MKNHTFAEGYMGTTVVGERGQIVIPKELRDDLELRPGTRLVLVRHGRGPVVMFPMEDIQAFIKQMTARVATLDARTRKK